MSAKRPKGRAAKPPGWTQEKRRATGGMVVMSVAVPQAVALLVSALAKRLDISRSEVVRRGIDSLWMSMPDDDELAAISGTKQ